jgi:hypothetical protein
MKADPYFPITFSFTEFLLINCNTRLLFHLFTDLICKFETVV